MTQPDPAPEFGDRFTRRQVLRGALAGGAALGAGGLLAACAGVQPGTGAIQGSPPTGGAKLSHGGSMSVGATGGSSTDTLDAHIPVTDPDIMRNWNMYESLAVRSPDFKSIDYLVAESIEPAHAGNAGVVARDPPPGRRVPQRQDGRARGRDLLAEADPRSQGPEDRRLVDRLHRHQGPQAGRLQAGPDPAEERQRRVRRRARPVLQRDRPGRLRPEEAGRHRRVHVRVVHARPAERVQALPQLLAAAQAVRRRADDHRLHRRHRARQRAARRPGAGDRQPPDRADRRGGGLRRLQGADLADRPVAAVHDARRRAAVQRCAGPAGDATDRRSSADGAAGAVGPGPRRQRHVRAARPGLQPRAAPAPPGHRAGQVAAQAGRPRGAERPAHHLAGVQRRRPGGGGVRPAGDPRRRQGQAQPGQHERLLRAPTTSSGRSPRTSGPPASTCRRWRRAARRRRRSTRPTGRPRTRRARSSPS